MDVDERLRVAPRFRLILLVGARNARNVRCRAIPCGNQCLFHTAALWESPTRAARTKARQGWESPAFLVEL